MVPRVALLLALLISPSPGDEPVHRLRLADLKGIDAFEMRDRPAHLAVNGEDLLVGSFKDGSLSVCDLASRALKRRYVLLKSGSEEAELVEDDGTRTFAREHVTSVGRIAVAGGRIFIATPFTASLHVLDARTYAPVAMLPIGGSGRFAVGPGDRVVYFASNVEPRFHVIDVRTLESRSVAYPEGARGIGAICLAPDGRLCLGIQRGGRRPGRPAIGGGNTFLAIYDLERAEYTGTVYLAGLVDQRSDDSSSSVILNGPSGLLYVGVWQSVHAFRVVDPNRLVVDHDVDLPVPNDPTYPFPWPNVQTAVFVGDRLVTLLREGEIHVWDPRVRHLQTVLQLGSTSSPNPGPALLHDESLYVSHPELRCVYVVPTGAFLPQP